MSLASCTILARNYLPRALLLADSLREHGSEHPLIVFLIDAERDTELPSIDGVRWMRPADLDLPEPALLDLAASYDLVEFATALKPLVLQALLEEIEQVAYLDPDTYVMAPMIELGPALDASAGIVLTPHYLEPIAGEQRFSEGHLLHVGVYNLGFIAVDRRAGPFLQWWWGHLQSECLHGPLDGLFTDQKWVDVGAVLFDASALRHHGYNVSVANLHERPIVAGADGYRIATSGDRLRLMHFHAFDPQRPDDLYGRARTITPAAGSQPAADGAVAQIARRYAAALIEKQSRLGPQPAYIYNADTTGRPISRRMRHAYRSTVLEAPGSLPSPFRAAEAAAYAAWRRGARPLAARLVLSDIAKGVRCALPDEYDALKRRFPGAARALRAKVVEDGGMWG
ncbi:hypothetical protein NBH00_14720 [Paraconexibacter antarcticus]|uniref:Glycosyl transferase n=1 Tax=Paraconexibacter antarcticus TaxID=2949664 RepID=A0ABY5DP18_9ACTN|nr:hypothetical protein [Paraconexibacter antarcticus]UTI62611.1 hypothetical protein NBH00_14720 [Paraconexibacter antarcticus]